MGVEFDRIFEGRSSGPFEVIPDWNLPPPAGTVPTGSPAAFSMRPVQVDTFVAANRLLGGQRRSVPRSRTESFLVINTPTAASLVRRSGGRSRRELHRGRGATAAPECG